MSTISSKNIANILSKSTIISLIVIAILAIPLHFVLAQSGGGDTQSDITQDANTGNNQQDQSSGGGPNQETSNSGNSILDSALPPAESDGGVNCSLFAFVGENSLACFLYGLSKLASSATGLILAIIGIALDFVIPFSISSSTYRAEFIVSIWAFIRDIANIYIVFLLAKAAVEAIIFGSDGYKRTIVVATLVLVTVNFSLFFVRVLTDAGNIASKTIYDTMSIESYKTDPNIISSDHSSALAIRGSKMLSLALLDMTDIDGLFNLNFSNIKEFSDPDDSNIIYYKMLANILITLVKITFIKIFYELTVLITGRVVSLWFHMMTAPYHLASFITAKYGSKKGENNKYGWFGEVAKVAFMPTIPLLGALIFIKIRESGIFSINIGPDAKLAYVLFQIAFVTILIYVGFKTILDKTKSMSDAIVNSTVEFADKIKNTIGSVLNFTIKTIGQALGFAIAGPLAGSIGNILGGGGIRGMLRKILKAIGSGTLGRAGKILRFSGVVGSSTMSSIPQHGGSNSGNVMPPGSPFGGNNLNNPQGGGQGGSFRI